MTIHVQPAPGEIPVRKGSKLRNWYKETNLGTLSFTFGVISTVFFYFFGCWWSIPCSVIGVILGGAVSARYNYNGLNTQRGDDNESSL